MLPRNLNQKQVEAVESPEGPLLIVAGAGSGKTKTLTGRLQYLISKGIDPASIIAITFTNKAADEMLRRTTDNLQSTTNQNKNSFGQGSSVSGQLSNGRRPFVGTFHSLGARILRKEARYFGREANFTIFDSDDSLSALKKVIKALNFAKEDKAGPASFRFYISKIKNELIMPADLADGRKLQVLGVIYDEYENELRRCNAFDFDDLIEKPVKLFRQSPEILNKYRNYYRYILVDEFQDVNTSQYEFIKLLAKEHKNINVVGDDAQSIYRFRSADFRHFLSFEKDWPGAKIVLLEQNYRSTGNIITAANAVIANNKHQKQKNLWTSNVAGEQILVMEHADEVEEAEWTASEIAKRTQGTKDKGQRTKDDGSKILSPLFSVQSHSTAVLYRTNAQSRAVEQALIEREIPYQIFGSIRFYERKEIKDLVACLRYASNPRDLVSLDRLSKNFLKKPFLELRAELPAKVSELSPAELIIFAINTTKYFDSLKKNYPNFEERIENINELLNFAHGYTDLGEFLEKITLLQSSDNENSKNNSAGQLSRQRRGSPEAAVANGQLPRVALMTIHIAKGLEFDKVYVLGCNEGLMPHQMSYSTPEEIEEERRLMYVAMTRAKTELALSFYNVGSRFLYEIPPELINFKSSLKPNAPEFFDDEERFITY